MTVGLFILFYPAAVLVVAGLGLFGNATPGIPTYLGVLVHLVFGVWFCLRRGFHFRFEVRNERRLSVVIVCVGVVIASALVLVIGRFGLPPALYVWQGEIPPVEVLFGAYREQLPLRAVLPSLIIASTVIMLLPGIAGVSSIIRVVVMVVIAIAFVTVYETRHALLWPFFYLLLGKYPVREAVSRRQLLGLTVGTVAIAAVFIVLGNLRTGITASDVRLFAEGNEMVYPFSSMPLPLVWSSIYFFGGTARGIAQEPNLALLKFELPAKFFPGPLQSFAGRPLQNLDDRFELQAFAIDGWHTYMLEFGVIGALIFTSFLFLLLLLLTRRVSEGYATQAIHPSFFLLVLWLSVRISLLPIGDYILDFAAFVELFFLVALGSAVGLTVIPVRRSKGLGSS